MWKLVVVVALLVMLWCNQACKVSPSWRGGMGVFARRFYRAGELVERGKFLEMREADVTGNILHDYVFQSPTTDGNVVLALGNVSLFNHATRARNAEHNVSPLGHVDIRASRLIWPGEEILISYGDDYWSSRGVRPF
jgi:SET domain-containing protein